MALGHSPQIVTQGLVFYIDPSSTKSYAGFGNTIYNMVNSSIGGTFVGYTSNPIDNTFTRSLAYDGSANYIQTNYIPYYTSDFTIEVWANFSRYNDFQAILSSMDNDNATNGFWFEFGSFRGFTIYSSGAQLVLEDNIVNLSNLELNKWHHIAVSRIGTGTNNIKLYVNNILCGQNTYTAAIGHTSRNMLVGRYAYGGNLYSYFKGNLGLIKIYNRGLTASEILQNFNATRKKYYPEERIVTDGLILNYDFSKRNSYPGTGSVVTDLSITGNNGSLVNSPSFSSLNGGGLVFNGSNQLINVASNPSLTNQITVSVWIKPGDTNGNSWIIGREGGYRLFYTSNLIIWDCATVNNSWYTTGTNILSPSLNVLNSWWHIVATYDGSNNRLYINGELKTTGANISGNITNGQNLWIMYVSVAGINYGKGTIGEIKIYNRALNQQEILQNYNATKNRFVNALPPVKNNLILELDAASVSSYSGTGNTWYDLSVSGYNGELNNGPVFSSIGTTQNFFFDGTNDYVQYSTNVIPPTSTPFTISLWCKRGRNINAFEEVLSQWTTGTSWNAFFLGFYGSLVRFSDNWDNITVSGAGTTNTWMNIVAINTVSNAYIYFNGSLAATKGGIGLTYTGSGPLTIGRQGQTAEYFQGNISQVQIHNRALSAIEIKQNFDYYRTRYGI